MITLSGRLICANAVEADLVATLLPEHMRLTRAEPGCLSFNVLPTADPLVWHVDEAFTDRAAFDAHQARTRASAWHKATAHLKRDYRTSGL
ncbi:putative quinol monooxygenase [Neotabrizicola sp. VNH66]|uniref:putative quinol monooxygenase n=1 Tax=Neotabrizicola sp. VNH66 TaxID=3400918 RepID=UPI003BFB5C73